MVDEAGKVFGPKDELPERQVVDDMDYTVSALKASVLLQLRKFSRFDGYVHVPSLDAGWCKFRPLSHHSGQVMAIKAGWYALAKAMYCGIILSAGSQTNALHYCNIVQVTEYQIPYIIILE